MSSPTPYATTTPALDPQQFYQQQPNYTQHQQQLPQTSPLPQQQQQQQQPQAPSRVKILASFYNKRNHNLPLFVPQVTEATRNAAAPTFTQRMVSRISGLRTSLRSPRAVMTGGCLELLALLYFFSRLNVLEGEYFRLGPPVYLFQYEVVDRMDFYMILTVFFFHQVTYTWITETLNPWLLNEVQDQKCDTIRYSKPVTLSVINLYTAYLTLNNILVLNIAFSQVSFLVVVLLADVVSTTLLNLSYIWHKTSICDDYDASPSATDKEVAAYAIDDEEAQMLLKKGYATIPSASTGFKADSNAVNVPLATDKSRP